jgi:maltose/moltooligosaccharide transporter
MQSFFIGIGAVIASMLPYLFDNVFGVANIAEEGKIPPTVKYSFYIGGTVFLLAVLWTIFRTREYSPKQLNEFDEFEKFEIKTARSTTGKSAPELTPVFLRNGMISMFFGIAISLVVYLKSLEKELFIMGGGLIFFGALMFIASHLSKNRKVHNGLVEIFTDMVNMPATMKQLSVVQFFSWFALFAMWIYTTAAVTSHIYGTSDTASELYNEGANWVGVLFGAYNGFAAAIAFLLPEIARYTSRKWTHAISLVIGGIAFLSFGVIKSPVLLLLPMLGIGFAWASILTMPYAILTGSLPSNKMGVYMGIFNFFIVIPQILAASILGFFMRQFFNGQAIYALIAAGISLFIASLMVVFVHDPDNPAIKASGKVKSLMKDI